MSAHLTWSPVSRAAGIEPRWTQLRQDAAGEANNHSRQGRALTLNLVVRAADAADATRVAEFLWKLGPRHPTRVLIVSPAATGLSLQAAAHPQGSELLHASLPPQRAASLLMPLLQSDLPVLLLWRGGSPGANPEFKSLAALADRVLVDAQYLGLAAPEIAALAQHLPARTHLADLSWTRLTPWRQLLYQGLEVEPGAFGRIAEVAITAPAGTANLPAVLLAGWLSRQLHWRPERPISPGSLRLTRESGPPVTLSLASAGQRTGALVQLRVAGEGFAVEILHHGPHLEMSVRHGEREIGHWAGEALTEQRSEADCLAVELSICGADPLYRGALEAACDIARSLEARA